MMRYGWIGGLAIGVLASNLALADSPFFYATVSTSSNFTEGVNYTVNEREETFTRLLEGTYLEQHVTFSSGTTINGTWKDSRTGKTLESGYNWTRKDYEYSYEQVSHHFQYIFVQRMNDVSGDNFLGLSITTSGYTGNVTFSGGAAGIAGLKTSPEGSTQLILPEFAYTLDGGSAVSMPPWSTDGSGDTYAPLNIPTFTSLNFFVKATDGGKSGSIEFSASAEPVNEGRVWQNSSDYTYQYFTREVAAVPEPETYAMLLAGLGLVGAMARRRKQA